MTLARIPLNDGTTLPAIGFGTYPLRGEEGITAMLSALTVGYRLLDSAVNYRNEEEVGEALRRSEVARDDVVVATKVPGRFHGFDDALAAVADSLVRLGVDQVDLVLIHWPNPSVGKYREAWQALVQARERGLTRSIGVSNFTEQHLHEIIADTSVTPVVNQVELHPYFPQAHMRAVHAELGIVTQAWSPLAKNAALLSEPAVVNAARAHDVTPGQVVLRWHHQLGVLPIPMSRSRQHQQDNLAIGGFTLSAQEMADIEDLGRSDGRRFDGDPRTHEEM